MQRMPSAVASAVWRLTEDATYGKSNIGTCRGLLRDMARDIAKSIAR